MKKNQLQVPILAFFIKAFLAIILVSFSGCSNAAKNLSENNGRYYLDDGPERTPPTDLDTIPDAIPVIEPLRKANMEPYVAFGKTFQPATRLEPYKKRGTATWYGRRYHGKKTAIGETYDMYAMTAAHPTLPLPSYARVTNLANGKSIVVRINDRGPFLSNRIIDLSYTGAYKLDMIETGSSEVEVESIIPETNTYTARTQHKPAENSGADIIYLQLGAFGTADNASIFLSNMQSELPWLVEALAIAENNGLYKIKAGPFANLNLAKHLADEIAQRTAIKPMLVLK